MKLPGPNSTHHSFGTMRENGTAHFWELKFNGGNDVSTYNDLDGNNQFRVLHNPHAATYTWESKQMGIIPHGAFAMKAAGIAYYIIKWYHSPTSEIVVNTFQMGQRCTSNTNGGFCSDYYLVLVVEGKFMHS